MSMEGARKLHVLSGRPGQGQPGPPPVSRGRWVSSQPAWARAAFSRGSHVRAAT